MNKELEQKYLCFLVTDQIKIYAIYKEMVYFKSLSLLSIKLPPSEFWRWRIEHE